MWLGRGLNQRPLHSQSDSLPIALGCPSASFAVPVDAASVVEQSAEVADVVVVVVDAASVAGPAVVDAESVAGLAVVDVVAGQHSVADAAVVGLELAGVDAGRPGVSVVVVRAGYVVVVAAAVVVVAELAEVVRHSFSS